tara:strand:+ start:490 stop:1575 length:1086 start_codon:yes stop_codon:yes gene_type:complete
MEFKVKEVGVVDSKSVQEVEQELLKKHEDSFNDDAEVASEEVIENEEPAVELQKEELTEESVLSFIKNKYGRDISSLDELTAAKESEEMPEDVAAYYKYKKETGRGFDDFAKLQVNHDEMDSDKLLRDYLLATEDGLDSEDIEMLMEDYSFDEELDDDSDIKKIKIARKKTIAKAKSYFNDQKEKYRVPLESSGSSISESDAEELEAYKQYTESAKTYEEEISRKRDWFNKKTDDVFGSEFKGFEFTLDDKKVTFSPGDATELKKIQSDPQNFINKFLNDDGLIEDAVGYHKALSIAMNPEKFAQYFYSQGKAEATDDVMRKTKNINMSERKTPEITSKGGMQIKSLDKDSGRGLRIKSKK